MPSIPLVSIMNSLAEKSKAAPIIFGMAIAKNSGRPVVSSEYLGQNKAS